MKRLHLILVLMALVCCLLLGTLLPVFADDASPAPASLSVAAPPDASPVIITEVQTGLAAAGDEFVELYNPGKLPVDLTGWQLRYQNATAASSSLLASLGDVQVHPVVAPGEYFVVHTASVVLPVDTAGQVVSAKLSAADKAIGLFAPDAETCLAQVQDAVAWGASTMGDGKPVATAVAEAGDRLIYRLIDVAGAYRVTRDNSTDFGTSLAGPEPAVLPTAGTVNTAVSSPDAAAPAGSASAMTDVRLNGCTMPQQAQEEPEPTQPTEPGLGAPITPVTPSPDDSPPVSANPAGPAAKTVVQPVVPARNAGLYAPQISELLPNPAKPQTDANDEFVELYNSNAVPFELSGFVLEAGSKTKKRYTFAQGTMLPAKSFTAFYAKDTTITLSNTAGQVWLLDPLQRTIAQSDAYAAAKDGQSWLSADKKWQWSTQPTPGAINVLRAPAAKDGKGSKGVVKSASTTKSSAASVSGGGSGTVTAAADANQAAEKDTDFNPLHPAILAITGVIAVSYGIYEYRSDLANRLHQFRANRAARAEARRSTPGR